MSWSNFMRASVLYSRQKRLRK